MTAMKRTYELMLVVRSDFEADNETQRLELVQKLVGDTVSVSEHTSLGKKPLAYPIQNQTEGHYFLVKLEGNGLSVAELEKRSRQSEQVLRFLLTKKE